MMLAEVRVYHHYGFIIYYVLGFRSAHTLSRAEATRRKLSCRHIVVMKIRFHARQSKLSCGQLISRICASNAGSVYYIHILFDDVSLPQPAVSAPQLTARSRGRIIGLLKMVH